MGRLLSTITITLISLSVIALLILAPIGCGDGAEANRLVNESEQLRQAATDRFRRQTAAIDVMVSTVASRKSLSAEEIITVTDTAASEYQAAIADLHSRSAKLEAAAALDLGDDYREYLRLMQASNDALIDAIDTAAEVPGLIVDEQMVFTGWNDARVTEVVAAIDDIRRRIDDHFVKAESLRVEAEQLRKDKPGDFE